MKIRVALAQIPVTLDIEKNVAAITRGIEFANENKANVLVTPEGSLSGYTHEFDRIAVQEALDRITSLAKNKAVGLALGTCFAEQEDNKCYNQLRFYLPDGTYLGYHSKTLTCGDHSNPPQGELNVFSVSALRTFVFEGIKIGGLICNDMWANPVYTPVPDIHLSQQLSDMGARIIFHAVNGGRDGSDWSRSVVWPYHETNLRMRARAGGIWIVTVDNSSPTDLPCSSPSGVIGPDGNWLCQIENTGEQFICYTIEI